MIQISWKAFEENVKLISSYIWNCNANKETIKGVNFDCVLKPKLDHWVIVEITEDTTLNKVRTDVGKFSSTRLSLMSEGIYPECFLVTKDEPTNSMQETGSENKIKVLSYISFSNLFLNYNSYYHVRTQKAFGSSVNPLSGEPDNIKYTPVFYENTRTRSNVDIKEISKLLLEGKKMILLGNYGTGKSRCIRELYFQLGNKQLKSLYYPLAINLKENWGTRKAEEMLRRHFDDLGLGENSNSIVKIVDKSSLMLLLDGFDEIGTQAWSDDPKKLKQIRTTALSGTKDLIQRCKGGLIITGREHYFNNDSEMFSLLGLNPQDTIVLRCKDEFSDDEMKKYLSSLSNMIDLPFWLPKRPIICQIINSLEVADIERIFIDSYSSVEFWRTLITNLCNREAKIHPILDKDTILKIFIEIGRMTRTKGGNIGPITVSEINKAFEIVVGSYPVDDSAVMLQRLPALGRMSSESSDRQFIDNYILDGLRAENLIQIVNENNTDVLNEKWINPLEKLGIEVVAKYIKDNQCANYFMDYLRKNSNCFNKVLLGDILASISFYASNSIIDIGGLIINDSTISTLNLSNSLIDNFMIKDSIIFEVDISNCSCSKISIKDCIIRKVYGLTKIDEAPSFIASNDIESCEKESLSYFDNKSNLNSSQMIFISIIKKIFFLGNQGKLENDILKSQGNKDDQKIATEILKILTREKLVIKEQDKKDFVYKQKSHQRSRMTKILADLTHSKDKLWLEISKLTVGNTQ